MNQTQMMKKKKYCYNDKSKEKETHIDSTSTALINIDNNQKSQY